MYSEKITLFNFYKSSLGDIWYPSVFENVNLLIDKAAITARYGAESKDNAILNIKYHIVDGAIMVEGKQYLPPKEWENQTNDILANTFTFTSGNDFDFFILGDYGEMNPINDDDFDGFYNYMKKNHDFCFAITSVAKYTAIPHFEIMGK